MADIAEIHELLESVRVTLASSMNPDREFFRKQPL